MSRTGNRSPTLPCTKAVICTSVSNCRALGRPENSFEYLSSRLGLT